MTPSRATKTALIGALVLLACLALPHRATAQPASEFYRGKTLIMYVGTGEGSGILSAYPRAIAAVIKKHIPGSPTIIVSHMPGGGGIKLANFMTSIGPQDGTAWAFITRGFLLAPLLKIQQAQYEPTKLHWIGSPARTVSVGIVWNASTKVRTIEDARREQVIVGATSPGQDTSVFPAALNQIARTQFKIVGGYKSVGDVDLAMEKREVQGKVGFTLNSLNQGRGIDWQRDNAVTVLVQLGLQREPTLPASVPLALDLAATPEERQMLEVLCAPGATGYPSFMGPGVPLDRVALIRDAYAATMRDPEFLEAAKRQQLDVDPIGHDELTRIIAAIYAQPAAAVERAAALLPRN